MKALQVVAAVLFIGLVNVSGFIVACAPQYAHHADGPVPLR